VSRREGDELTDVPGWNSQEGPEERRRRDTIGANELGIKIEVSYKTLALIFALFSVLGHIVDSVTRTDLSKYSETLLGIFPF